MSTYRLIPLTKGKYTKVDCLDYHHLSLFKWTASYDKTTKSYYARRRGVKMHRLILEANNNELVDHINHDTLDNRRNNLRLCSQSQSSINRRVRVDNKSGYVGVRPDTRKYRKKWLAFIGLEGSHITIGNFDNKNEAAYVRDQFAMQLHNNYAVLNIL